MRILMVGGGGREHAIVKALSRSTPAPEIYAYMASANPGIAALAREITVGSMRDAVAIADYAWKQHVDLVVGGPEEPLMYGLSDEMYRRGIPCVGPRKVLANMEGDKTFLRSMAAKYVPEANPAHRVCGTAEEVHAAIKELGDVAVKPLGLTSGKGVRVMGVQLKSQAEAEEYASSLAKRDGKVLIEERLVGEEFSQMVFSDGVKILPMPLVQDAKYAFEGDTGPMTGGMGSYSMPDHRMPFVSDTVRKSAIQTIERLLSGVQDEFGERYHGVLYGQFMNARSGLKLIEVNVRLGDPEAINVMALLKTDPAQVFAGMACGLPKEIEFQPVASVCKYLVPQGYPEHGNEHPEVTFDWKVFDKERTEIVFAGAEKVGEAYRATGSRFAAVFASRASLQDAEAAVERTIETLRLPGLRHRKDIATKKFVDRG